MSPVYILLEIVRYRWDIKPSFGGVTRFTDTPTPMIFPKESRTHAGR